MIYKRFLAVIALSLFAIQLHPNSKSLRDRELYAAELSPKSITLQILFNSGQSQIEWHLANNLENAERFFTQLDSLSKEPGIKISNRVHIFASASPEGISTLNNELSQKRAEELAALLKERSSKCPNRDYSRWRRLDKTCPASAQLYPQLQQKGKGESHKNN